MNITVLPTVALLAWSVLVTSGQSREELSAIESLRAIFSAEATYSAVCVTGGFATSLDDLGKPDRRDGSAFIMRDLSANGATRGGYKFSIAKGARKGVSDVSTAAATCNGSKANPATSFFATGEPTEPSRGDRFFAVDERAIIFFSDKPIRNPIVESATVIRYQ